MAPKYLYLLTLSPVVILLDQITKIAVYSKLDKGDSVTVIPNLLNIVHVHNKGMVFGQMSHMKPVFFIGLSVVAFAVLINLFRQITPGQKGLALTVALVFAGAVGNLIDRVRLGFVIDFIDMYVGRHHWPSYNVADIAIVIGAVLLALEMFKKPEEDSPSGESKPAPQR